MLFTWFSSYPLSRSDLLSYLSSPLTIEVNFFISLPILWIGNYLLSLSFSRCKLLPSQSFFFSGLDATHPAHKTSCDVSFISFRFLYFYCIFCSSVSDSSFSLLTRPVTGVHSLSPGSIIWWEFRRCECLFLNLFSFHINILFRFPVFSWLWWSELLCSTPHFGKTWNVQVNKKTAEAETEYVENRKNEPNHGHRFYDSPGHVTELYQQRFHSSRILPHLGPGWRWHGKYIFHIISIPIYARRDTSHSRRQSIIPGRMLPRAESSEDAVMPAAT